MSPITDLKIELVDYWCDGKTVRGSNLTYRVDGQPRSSRVPWVATDPAAEIARLDRLFETTSTRKEAP